MPCPEAPRLQLWLDGEADAMTAAAFEQHLAQCRECRADLDQLRGLRQALRATLSPQAAPAVLRARILDALDAQAGPPAGSVVTGLPAAPAWRQRVFWGGALSGLIAAGLAAALVLPIAWQVSSNPLLDELAAAHLRSLQPSRLIAVVSTDRHTVKPWFAGRADVAPAVADFAAQGYGLLGGRVDEIQGQRAAVLVYRHGAHLINLFSWERGTQPLPREGTRRGYRIACWSSSDLGYCAVSDADSAELRGLEDLVQGLGP